MNVISNLREKGFVSEEKLKMAGDSADESEILQSLEEKRLIPSEEILKARSEVTGLPINSISEDFQLSRDLLELLPGNIIKRYKVIPIQEKENGDILIGLTEPENIEVQRALDFIEVSHNISFDKVVVSNDDFRRALQKITDLEVEVKEVLEQITEEEKKPSQAEKAKEEEREEAIRRLTQKAPVAQIVDVILRYGVEGGASDIHIEPTTSQLRVRYRLDGKLKLSLLLPRDLIPSIVSRIKILAGLRVDETRIPQGGRLSQRFDSILIDFRVSTLPTVEGEKVVIRILDSNKGIVRLEQLGLQHKALEDVQEFVRRPFGALLISGPTGSGKSTTLYSVLSQLNKEEVNIVTLEDPVEYFLPGVNQSQVHPEIKYTFASGLRDVLRQDPNVIMVGEVRDQETAKLLIHASLTGHLVLSTIHTNDAVGILPRLLDMGIDSFIIPSALRLAVAQRLLPRLCQNCKEPYAPPLPIREIVEGELALLSSKVLSTVGEKKKDLHFFVSKGCGNCGNTGTKGRIAIFESLVVDDDLATAVVQEPSESKFRGIARKQGMISMRQDGILKALEGLVSFEAVLAETTASLPRVK